MPNCSAAAARLLVPVVWPPLSSLSSFLLTVSPRPPRHDLAFSHTSHSGSEAPAPSRCSPTLLSPVAGHLLPRILSELSLLCPSPDLSLLSVAPVPGHPGPKVSLFCLHLEHTVFCGTAQADGAVTSHLRLFWLQVTENSYWNHRDPPQTQRSWHQTQLNPAVQMAP